MSTRTEQEIFDELAGLCAAPGYVHAIAFLCFRDNMLKYSGDMTAEDMQPLFSKDRLIRTEISTLLGLTLKHDIDFTPPTPQVVEKYIEATETLLAEFHHAMMASIFQGLDPSSVSDGGIDPFYSGTALREPIFYGGESAYSFQYRDFSPAKYGRDTQWMVANKGFSIQDARNVVHTILQLQNEKAHTTFEAMWGTAPDTWSLLPIYSFTVRDVADRASMDSMLVERILGAFTVSADERNDKFQELHDFNVANATPLIRTPEGNYLLFQVYSLVEALYESPFYWMGADKAYVSTAMENRGLFTEQFAIKRLEHVFGLGNVLFNIDIFESKGRRLGEIDVLVFFGNRALVLQAKSKRLTAEARRGNDLKIKDDFKKSVQDSSDQAYRCAELLEEGKCLFKDASGTEIFLPTNLKRIYVLCLISDHYPALSFQARQFLNFTPTATISPPFVIDVFALDAMTEMLSSPLQFLSYVDRRTGYTDKLMAPSELTILSYHLKQNLWVEDGQDFITLGDDISADLDVAMLVRRDGIDGQATPDGILTRLASTALGSIIKVIENRPDPATIDLGFMLLTLSESTVDEINTGIEKITKLALRDGKPHNLVVGIGAGKTGLTIHCNNNPVDVAGPNLQRHCHDRKYTQRAQTWYGICIQPSDRSLRFGINLDFAWEHSDKMDTRTKIFSKPSKFENLPGSPGKKRRKVGRNESCPCGSGKKFKKCCIE